MVKKINKNIVVVVMAVSFQFSVFSWWGSSSQQEGSETDEDWSCRFKNMGGTLPNDACKVRDFLMRVKKIMQEIEEKKEQGKEEGSENKKDILQEERGRAYMFYGDRGLGKTKTAELIAEEGEVLTEFHSVDDLATAITAAKVADEVIIQIYDAAKAQVKKEGMPVVIVIDEIDKLFEDNPQVITAVSRSLCSRIDKYKNDPSIATIITSNTVKNFDYGLFRRCMHVEWLSPSQKNREAILRFYAKKNDIKLSEKFIKKMAKKTPEFTGAHFEVVYAYATEDFSVVNEKAIKKSIAKVQKSDIDSHKSKEPEQASMLEQAENFAKKNPGITKGAGAAIGTVTLGVGYAVADVAYYKATGKHLSRPGLGEDKK